MHKGDIKKDELDRSSMGNKPDISTKNDELDEDNRSNSEMCKRRTNNNEREAKSKLYEGSRNDYECHKGSGCSNEPDMARMKSSR